MQCQWGRGGTMNMTTFWYFRRGGGGGARRTSWLAGAETNEKGTRRVPRLWKVGSPASCCHQKDENVEHRRRKESQKGQPGTCTAEKEHSPTDDREAGKPGVVTSRGSDRRSPPQVPLPPQFSLGAEPHPLRSDKYEERQTGRIGSTQPASTSTRAVTRHAHDESGRRGVVRRFSWHGGAWQRSPGDLRRSPQADVRRQSTSSHVQARQLLVIFFVWARADGSREVCRNDVPTRSGGQSFALSKTVSREDLATRSVTLGKECWGRSTPSATARR